MTIEPVSPSDVRVGDVVLVKWRGGHLLHLVKEISAGRFLIGNNVGKTNGWAPAKDVLGKVVSISD